MPVQGQGTGVVTPPKKRAPVVTPPWYPSGDPTTHQTPPPAGSDAGTTPTQYGGGGGGTGGGQPGPPAPGPAGSLNIPGFNPDYQQLLLSDPAYMAWASAHPGVMADLNTTRGAAIRALAAQFGGVPQGFTDTYGDLTPGDLAAAAANPYSSMAQLKTQYDQNLENARKGLAGRGQLHSGDLGYMQDQLQNQLGSSQYDLSNQFLSTLQSILGNYTGGVHNEELNKGAAIGQAYQDVTGNPAYQPTPAATATLIPTWQSDYGTPVYQTGDGRLYTVDSNGNPVLYTG